MKMVIAFNVNAIEVKSGCHAADTIVCLKNNRLMAVLDKLISDSQTHRARAQYCDALAAHV